MSTWEWTDTVGEDFFAQSVEGQRYQCFASHQAADLALAAGLVPQHFTDVVPSGKTGYTVEDVQVVRLGLVGPEPHRKSTKNGTKWRV